MTQYLLDTSICVFLLRNKYNVKEKINEVGYNNCFISEVSIAELKYGAQCSNNPEQNNAMCEEFVNAVNVVPFNVAIDYFSEEKARLRKLGTPVEDFDLLIGCTSVAAEMTLVTDNVRHFERVNNITIENWIQR